MSLPDDDVRFLDEHARAQGLESRSAAVQKAIRLLRAAELGEAYVDAWDEWADSDDAALWDGASGDGMSHASR